MSPPLPVYIDPFRLVELRQQLQGYIPLAEMQRIAASLVNRAGDVQVDLRFGRDEVGNAYIKGRVKADLKLQCQRCMESIDFPVDTKVSLGVVSNDTQAELLPGAYEPVVFKGEPLLLSDLIEDELILALPAVARHDEGGCGINETTQRFAQHEPLQKHTDALSDKSNPFAVLESLKKELQK